MSDGDEQHPLDDMSLADVYAAGGAMEADRITLLLQDEGIEAVKREVSVSEFPSTATQRYLILAPETDKARAQDLIRGAIRDGIIPEDGTFL
jgi:hypothetical protein